MQQGGKCILDKGEMLQVFGIPKSMKKDFKYTFCPGCDHGVAMRLVAELISDVRFFYMIFLILIV